MRARRPVRRGLSSMEAVMATGITVPVATFFLVVGFRACKYFYHTVATLVCWPYI